MHRNGCFVYGGPVLDRYLRRGALLPQPHQRLVDRDPCKPGGESGFPFESLQIDEGLLEALLDDVLRVLLDTDEAHRNGENPPPMPPDKDFERLLISVL